MQNQDDPWDDWEAAADAGVSKVFFRILKFVLISLLIL